MTIKINLLQKQPEVGVKSFLAVAVVAVLIHLLWHMVLQQKIAAATKYQGYLQQELSALIIPAYNDNNLIKQQSVEQRLARSGANLEQKRADFVQIFEMLQQGVSRNLYLTQLLIKNGEVKIVGHARSMSDLMRLATMLTAYKHGSNTPSIQKITSQNSGYSFVLFMPKENKGNTNLAGLPDLATAARKGKVQELPE